MPLRETLWLGRDNTIDLALIVDGKRINHTSITRCIVDFGSVQVDSSTASDAFSFTASKLILKLGETQIQPGVYSMKVITFDAANMNGIVWGFIPVEVKQDVENQQP